AGAEAARTEPGGMARARAPPRPRPWVRPLARPRRRRGQRLAPRTARARRGRRRPSRAAASSARPLVGAPDTGRLEAPPAREELAAHGVAGRGAPAGRGVGARLEGDEVGGVVHANLQRALPGILDGDRDGEGEAHAITVQARA